MQKTRHIRRVSSTGQSGRGLRAKESDTVKWGPFKLVLGTVSLKVPVGNIVGSGEQVVLVAGRKGRVSVK